MNYTKWYQTHNSLSVGITPVYWKRLGLHFRLCRGLNICIELGPAYLEFSHHDKATRKWLTSIDERVEKIQEAIDAK